MIIECHKWETVRGRLFRPVLRIWDGRTGQYVGEPGCIDCFDSPQTAQLAALKVFDAIEEEFLEQSKRVFGAKKVVGTVYPDPIRQGPFPTLRAAVSAAQECRWDQARGRFEVDPETLVRLSIMLDIGSMKAQTDTCDFIERYMQKVGGRIELRQVRVITTAMLNSKRLKFYEARKIKKPPLATAG